MKDLGELRFFLGIEFARSDKGILMHQRKYTLELLSELGLTAAKPICTPMDYNLKLTSRQFDDHVKQIQPDEDTSADKVTYQKLIGKILYLTITRPDIAFCVQTLSQFLKASKKSHIDAALRIVRYVKNQPGQGVLLSNDPNEEVSAFCDVDWIGKSVVAWKSKKQATVSRSSAEAEFRSLAAVTAELVWIVGLMTEIGI
ncbi:uncharacterized mitochondrial protein AtMg00810-like [Capsicum annuum]|uniref:uncharacterized mitochondrial protein AtMg00810-like n=1 Tax=Capsicum annuum TaxID=4072 RepID=UPI001FB09771|nr:uncharacterized mitochondrial protein AtMg00810-like [Capsicum annuum]